MFSRFGSKIAFGFGFVMLLLILVAATATVSFREVHDSEEQVLVLHHRHQYISNIKYLLAMESSSNQAYLLYREERYREQHRQYHEQLVNNLDSLLDITGDPEERQYLTRFKELSKEYWSILDGRILPLAAEGRHDEAAAVAGNLARPTFNAAYSLIDQFDSRDTEEFNRVISSGHSFTGIARSMVAAMSALSLVVGVLFAVMLTRRVTRPVNELLGCAVAVAGGNLETEAAISGRDEIASLGGAFNRMVYSLRQQRDELTSQNEEIRAQEEELTSTLEQVSHERSKLEALNDFSRAINTSIQLQDLCQNITMSCLGKVGAQAAAVAVVNPESGKARYEFVAGLKDMSPAGGEAGDLQGLAGRCLREKAVITASYPKTALSSAVILDIPCPTAHEVYIPAVFRGKALGVLVAARLSGAPFSEDEINLLENMIRQGAIAINNALEHLQVENMYRKVLDQAESVRELNTRLESEKANLKRAQEITRAVIESLNEAVVMLDLDGRVAAVNRRWEDFFGDSAPGLYGLGAEDLYRKTVSNLENAEEVMSELSVATGGPVTTGETQAVMENRVLTIWTGPVLRQDGKVLGRLFVYRDITREAEIDRMKSEFVSTVSHELRTPLSSILGFSELLLTRDVSGEPRQKYISIIHKEAGRLTNLVNDFLDLQRMESGYQTYHMERIDAGKLISEVIDSFSTRGHSRPITVKAREGPEIYADRERITQVLLNLLSNAVKFSPDGSEITIGVEPDGEFARFSVRDRGLGIPEDARGSLFTKFFRVDNSDRRKIGGTGLGLAISREIVESHGGRIWVRSEHGQGSTFYFTVRLSGRVDEV